jgi:DNA-binding XRE family transcriptional regulator
MVHLLGNSSICTVKKKLAKKKKIGSRVFIFDEKGLKAFAKTLKKVRKEQGFTQESLANEAGMSVSQIARIETIKINPSLSTVFQIARTLKVPISRLFDFKLPKGDPDKGK